MKPKDYCQECGRLICKKKLQKSPKDGRYLCKDCFRRIVGIKLIKEPIVPQMNNVSDKERNELRMVKIRKKCNYLGRSDVDFLKEKYGVGSYKKISKLWKHLGNNRMKDVLDDSESNDRQRRENKMKKFLGGMK